MSIQNDTSIQSVNLHIIVTLLLRNKTFNPINKKYGINYHCITLLLSCYVYDRYVRKDIKLTNISSFTGYLTVYKVRKYFGQLISLGFIKPLAGNSFQVTDKINDIIKDIADSYNTTLYKFCSLHSIDL